VQAEAGVQQIIQIRTLKISDIHIRPFGTAIAVQTRPPIACVLPRRRSLYPLSIRRVVISFFKKMARLGNQFLSQQITGICKNGGIR
jgi:type II secretory ATPase GspE/PulE/Tfp pilus assembly ATPase PilB-like protein